MCYPQVPAVGRIADGVGSKNDMESPLDMVKAPHSVQQPVDVAKGNHCSVGSQYERTQQMENTPDRR